MAAVWDEETFGCIERDSFVLRPMPRTVVSTADTPPVRSKTGDVRAPIEAQFSVVQTQAQQAAFTQWYRYDLAGGALPFQIDLWLWNQIITVRARFTARWSTRQDAFNRYQTEGMFEIERESIPPITNDIALANHTVEFWGANTTGSVQGAFAVQVFANGVLRIGPRQSFPDGDPTKILKIDGVQGTDGTFVAGFAEYRDMTPEWWNAAGAVDPAWEFRLRISGSYTIFNWTAASADPYGFEYLDVATETKTFLLDYRRPDGSFIGTATYTVTCSVA